MRHPHRRRHRYGPLPEPPTLRQPDIAPESLPGPSSFLICHFCFLIFFSPPRKGQGKPRPYGPPPGFRPPEPPCHLISFCPALFNGPPAPVHQSSGNSQGLNEHLGQKVREVAHRQGLRPRLTPSKLPNRMKKQSVAKPQKPRDVVLDLHRGSSDERPVASDEDSSPLTRSLVTCEGDN